MLGSWLFPGLIAFRVSTFVRCETSSVACGTAERRRSKVAEICGIGRVLDFMGVPARSLKSLPCHFSLPHIYAIGLLQICRLTDVL